MFLKGVSGLITLIHPFSCVVQLYTVVQHVKHFNDVVEFGENQEFTDDFEYLATGLKTGQPLNTRCLRYEPAGITFVTFYTLSLSKVDE